MEPVILMVSRDNDLEVYDLEVMPDVLISDLADAIASALQWPGTYDIEVSGQRLTVQQCLADANVWDGAKLRLVPSNRPVRRSFTGDSPAAQQATVQPAGSGPVINWQPMQLQESKETLPASSPVPPPSSPLKGWRQPEPSKEKKS